MESSQKRINNMNVFKKQTLKKISLQNGLTCATAFISLITAPVVIPALASVDFLESINRKYQPVANEPLKYNKKVKRKEV